MKEHKNEVAKGYYIWTPKETQPPKWKEKCGTAFLTFIEGSLQNFFFRTKRIQDSNGFIMKVLRNFLFQ